MTPRRRLLSLLAGLLLAEPARADLVVIAHPRAGVDQLTREQVVNIFLGRFRQFPSGIAAEPIDLPPDTAEKAAFYQKLVGKELAEINAYWARLVFSGRTQPPRQASGATHMVELVAGTPGAIGYVERPKGESKVKIVFELEAAR
ncbi:MAG: hypothetical protein Q8O25_14270 [Sulfurisoma sp.]|nr:hypothetical protein [Sulfurisoma sp.]